MSRPFLTTRRDVLRLSLALFAGTATTTDVLASTVESPSGILTSITESKAHFQSGGKTITVERFEPSDPGKYPGVLVIHGSGGMTLGGPSFRETARGLAKRGYVAHVVHYFDLTGTTIADRSTMEKHFARWMRTLAEAITYLENQPNVDAKRIGLVGFSLGGFLSVSLSVYDHRVLAVADYFGGLPDVLAKDVKNLPPLLILHGDADLIVPVAEAKKLEALCLEKNAVHEVKIYKGQGHGFRGEEGADASRRCVSFLDEHVKSCDTARPRRPTAMIPSPDTITKAEKSAANSNGR